MRHPGWTLAICALIIAGVSIPLPDINGWDVLWFWIFLLAFSIGGDAFNQVIKGSNAAKR